MTKTLMTFEAWKERASAALKRIWPESQGYLDVPDRALRVRFEEGMSPVELAHAYCEENYES
jgi:hypothetical protein